MKHWSHFSRVVSYLERVEAGVPDNTPKGRYLVWTDDDGPHMIAGPGIHWYRGDGPMPDLDSLELPVSEGSATRRRSLSTPETPTGRSLRTRPNPNTLRPRCKHHHRKLAPRCKHQERKLAPRCKRQERKLARQNSSQKRLKVSHVKKGEQKENTFLKSVQIRSNRSRNQHNRAPQNASFLLSTAPAGQAAFRSKGAVPRVGDCHHFSRKTILPT